MPTAVDPEPKKKRFLYKEAQFLKEIGDAAVTFESLLKAALANLKIASKRMEEPAGSGNIRFINYHLHHGATEKDGIYGCEFLGFERGADQSTIELDPDAEQVSVDSIPAGKDKEFLAGAVYFAVAGNHVVLFQSAGLRTLELEAHLNWLLKRAAKVLGEDNGILLTDFVPEEEKRSIKGARGIRISSPVKLTTDYSPEKLAELQKEAKSAKAKAKRTNKKTPDAVPEPEPKSITIKPEGEWWRAFKNVIGKNVALPDKFNVDDLTKIPAIEVEIFLHFVGRHEDDAGEFLDSVASQMRHIDEEIDYTVEAKSGTYSRDEIKIREEHLVQWNASGRPKLDLLFPMMAVWLVKLINESKVRT